MINGPLDYRLENSKTADLKLINKKDQLDSSVNS